MLFLIFFSVKVNRAIRLISIAIFYYFIYEFDIRSPFINLNYLGIFNGYRFGIFNYRDEALMARDDLINDNWGFAEEKI